MKSARKAAQNALYESRKLSGQNSKRTKLKAKRARTLRPSRHASGPCHNVGCPRCNPISQNLLPPSQLGLLKK